MVIDFHTHVFPDRIAERAIEKLSLAAHLHPFLDGTAGALLASM